MVSRCCLSFRIFLRADLITFFAIAIHCSNEFVFNSVNAVMFLANHFDGSCGRPIAWRWRVLTSWINSWWIWLSILLVFGYKYNHIGKLQPFEILTLYYLQSLIPLYSYMLFTPIIKQLVLYIPLIFLTHQLSTTLTLVTFLVPLLLRLISVLVIVFIYNICIL